MTDTARLARGEYLVKYVCDCEGCHSDHDYKLWDIPVKAGTEFQGGFTFDKKFGVPGTVAAQNVQLTVASLGAANATVLPAVLGSIPGGGSATITLTFPSSAGAPGAGVVEKLTGTYTGGTFGGSFRASLPKSQQPS